MAYDDPQCELVRLARERQKRDLIELPKKGFVFDESRAKRVVNFFERNLYHSKGEWAGDAFLLEPWQKRDIIYPAFGWVDQKGIRRFKVIYMELPRKNGKSTLFSGIGNYCFIADQEPGAEVYTAATKKDQAKIVHDEAVRMVKKSPVLSDIVTVYRNNMNIFETASKFEPLGADSQTLDGLNTHCALIDELHAHKNRLLYDLLLTSIGARRQPLIASITTAGYDRHSVCYELRDYSEKILRQILEDDSFFCYVTTIDDDDDWRDPKTWAKANPNLNISIKQSYLEDQLKKALASNAYENTFKRLHLNIWTEQDVRWLKMEAWDQCSKPILKEDLYRRECFVGLDLSSTKDISAASFVFPNSDGSVDTFYRFWVPEENMRERGLKDRVPYEDWARQGLISPTPGNVIDYDYIRKEIVELAEQFRIREVAIDSWNAQHIMTQLDGDGLTVVPMRQGWATLSAPSKELEAYVLKGRLNHGANPVIRWMASNVAVETDAAGNIKPSKKVSTERIDGIVALVMALGRYSVHKSNTSIYSKRGLISI